jgi:hypothetical protein
MAARFAHLTLARADGRIGVARLHDMENGAKLSRPLNSARCSARR